MVTKCPSITADGEPCKGRVLPGRVYCLSHDPERKDAQREAARRGGAARANARRAAKQWAAIGEQMDAESLPAILRACMLSVKAGTLEPSQASAIANLAKTSVSITNELELEERIKALEEAAGLVPSNVRRLA